MLNMLRKKAQSPLIQGLVLLIAVVFIFWGVGSNLNQNRNAIAVVNGAEISLQDFQRNYEQAVERFRQQFGGQLPPGLLEGAGLKQQVLNQMIRSELIRQGGGKMGIQISDAAVQREIEKIDAFRENGHFDVQRYSQVLGRNRLTPVAFEKGVRSDLLTRRVEKLVGSFAVVPDSEVQAWIDFANEELRVSYLGLSSEDFRDKVKVDDADLAAWFEQHRDAYKSEPAIRVRYLFFPFTADEAAITVTDDEVRARYEADRARYEEPEKRHARHILFQVTATDSDAARAEKKKKAEEVLALARKGGDFAGLARKYSEGPSRKKGGDLGFFTRRSMVKPFADAVFSMQPGTVSGIVETPFGYHIIKLEEVRPARVRPLEEVRSEITAELQREKAAGLTFKRATRAYEEIMRTGSLDKYGRQKGAEKVEKTDFFTRSNPPAGITANRDFLARAFALQKGELSSLVRLDKGYAIIFVEDVRPPEVPALDKVRDRVVADYRKDQAVRLAREAAEKLLQEAREKGSLAAVHKELAASAYVKRSAAATSVDPPAPVIQDAFALAGDAKLPEQPVDVANTFYVYEVLDRRPGRADEKTDRKKIAGRLMASLRNRLVSDWLTRLQADSEIWINSEYLK
ncbi:SurA N-terminal domain-containing protein [Thermodesulfobacteriota bacterium B35]